MKKINVRFVAGFFLATILSGCATLMVDVDVYKGTMANQDEVQTQQLAVMAIGSKPLLLELRDFLEENGDGKKKWQKYKEQLAEDKNMESLNRFVRDDDYHFTDFGASRVNGVLSLYEDNASAESMGNISEIRQANGDYRKSFSILRPDEETQKNEAAKWQRLRSKLRTWIPEKGGCEGFKLSDYQKRFENFLAPPVNQFGRSWRGRRELVRHFSDSAGCMVSLLVNENGKDYWKLNGLKMEEIGAVFPKPDNDKKKISETITDNTIFDFLSQPNVAKAHALLLLGDDADDTEKQELADWIQKVSRSFLDSRNEISRMMRNTIIMLQVFKSHGDDKDFVVNNREEFLEHGAKFVVELIGKKYFEHLGRDGKWSNNTTNGMESPQYRKHFVNFLMLDPISVGSNLLKADEEVRRDYKEAVKSGEQEKIYKADTFQYGLATAPVGDYDPLEMMKHFDNMMGHLEGASGLGRGRLNRGLEQLVEDYLLAYDKDPLNDEAAQEEKMRLFAGLVSFSEKILKVANFSVLLKPEVSDPTKEIRKKINPLTSVLQAVGNTVIAQVDALIQKEKHEHRLRGERASWEFTAWENATQSSPMNLWLGLEKSFSQSKAVASILVTIRKEVFGKIATEELDAKGLVALVKGKISEAKTKETVPAKQQELAQALEQIESYGSGGGLAMTSLSIAQPQSVLGTLELLESRLRQEHLEALRNNRSDQATNLGKTMKQLGFYRSALVYVRPTSAYLRAAFPATITQSENPASSWRNELQHQFLRTLPLIGWAMDNSETEKKIRNEIDAQSWQRVNRVRVSGAGNTNYVVAKDEMGNWYVKNYSSDVSTIVKQMPALASYALGVPNAAGMVKKLEAANATSPQPPIAEPEAEKSTIPEQAGTAFIKAEAVLTGINKADISTMATWADELVEKDKGVQQALKDAGYDQLKDECKGLLDPSVVKETGKLKGSLDVVRNKSNPTTADVLELMKMVDQFRSDVHSSLALSGLGTVDGCKEVADTSFSKNASAKVDDLIKGKLHLWIHERGLVLKEHQGRLQAIQDMAFGVTAGK